MADIGEIKSIPRQFPGFAASCASTGTEYAMHIRAMKKMILCSSNPLLVKNLYGMLRDAGYAVEAVEHPALAVKKVLSGGYDFVVVDAEPFGLSAEDAARIIRTIAPEMPIFSFGGEEFLNPSMITLPADLEAIKEMLHHSAA